MIAAIDLGSNSFHMVIARFSPQGLQVIDRIKEFVRLAEGLEKDFNLNEEYQQHAIACLKRFQQRLMGFSKGSVRAVGTNTFRRAKNADAITKTFEQALGYPIEIISGTEEARLIYMGARYGLADDNLRQLVADIGGGSTEIIIGKGEVTQTLKSHSIGCALINKKFFKKGKLSKQRFKDAVLYAGAKFESSEHDFAKKNWDVAIGTSGTIRLVESLVIAYAWSEEGITAESIKCLIDKMIDIGDVGKLDFPGLESKRRPLFVGGVAILAALFKAFDITQMGTSCGALREGLLLDLTDRLRDHDIRDKSVLGIAARYHVDLGQAKRVEKTLISLCSQGLFQEEFAEESLCKWCKWLSLLHEIGLDIAHRRYHQHSAYIVENADLPGFSRMEQKILAAIILSHRRKFQLNEFKQSVGTDYEKYLYITILFRIAILLHRNRHEDTLPPVEISMNENDLVLNFSQEYIDNRPLTRIDLEQERDYLQDIGINLIVEELDLAC